MVTELRYQTRCQVHEDEHSARLSLMDSCGIINRELDFELFGFSTCQLYVISFEFQLLSFAC